MLTVEDLRRSYQYFYRKTNRKIDYEFQYSHTSLKQSENFFLYIQRSSLVVSSLGYNFLWRYLLFQFSYWEGVTISSFNQKMNFSFIFGHKAFLRYLDRNQEFDYQIEESSIINTYKLSFVEFLDLFNTKIERVTSHRNPNRLRHHNTPDGFSICITTTTLYDHKDLSCVSCIYRDDCRKLLQINYPKIYQERGYAKSSNS